MLIHENLLQVSYYILLQPENILLSTDDLETLIKVTDFGLSKFVDAGSIMKTFCGTPTYLAPEILETAGTGAYTKSIDVWSLGVILFIWYVAIIRQIIAPDKRGYQENIFSYSCMITYVVGNH